MAIRNAVSQQHADVGTDAATLLQRARNDYEKAIASNGDDLLALYGLAEVIVSQRDQEAAKKLEPLMEQALYRNPRDADLARGLADLCILARDLDSAFKFAVAWQKYATSDAEWSKATDLLSRLKAYMAQHPSASVAQP